MPRYDYECQACGFAWEDMLPMRDNKKPCEKGCPECDGEVKQVILQLNIADPVRIGVKKPSSQFNDVLAKIHSGMPGSKLNQKLSQNPKPKTSI